MPDQDTIVVKCPCGANLRVSASAAGKRIKCPKCGEPFRINPLAPPPAAPIPEPASLDDDLLGSLGESESSAASTESHRTPFDTEAIRCHQCGAKMQAEARLCTACGFDTVTGKMLSGVDVASPGAKAASPVAETGKAAVGAAGPFLMGTFLSMIGTGIGGAVWFAIAHYTGYEVGYVAIGIGFLAGLGMAIGYSENNTKASVVASCAAVLGILGAKVVIFTWIFAAITTGNTSNHDLQRAFVTSYLAEEILEERGVETEENQEAEWESAYKEAQARTTKMGRNEIRQHWEEYRDLQESEDDEAEEVELATNESLGEGGQSAAGALTGLFFETMFGAIDFLFLALAIGAAYRTASGLSRDSE